MSSHMKSNLLSRIGTVLTMIGSALGFGSIWRFPQQVSVNGGLSFILIYVLSGIIVAVPIFAIESLAGQLSRGTLFDGAYMTGENRLLFIGAAFVGVLGIYSYYPTLLAYTGQYLIRSFKQPWYPSQDDFKVCATYKTQAACGVATCASTDYCVCTWSLVKEVCLADMFRYASGYFDTVTRVNKDFMSDSPKDGWGYITEINWELYAIYIVNAIIALLSVMFGDSVLKKVVYITLLPSFGIVFGLLFYNFTLDGIGEGLRYYAGTMDASKLIDVDVIRSAMSQMVFALTVGTGVMPVLAGMNSMADSIGIPSWIVVISTVIFGCISGCIVFSMLGYLALETGESVTDGQGGGLLGEGGAGLIFITYSSGISHIFDGGVGAGWIHLLFWLMLYFMGFTSLVSLAKGIIMIFGRAKFSDVVFGDKGLKKTEYITTAVLFVCMCLFGIISCSDYGNYFVTSIDHFVGNMILPGAVGTHCWAYTWAYNEAWYIKNYGKLLRRCQNLFLMFLLWLIALNRFIFRNVTTINYVWLSISLIIPLIQPFVFAIFLMKRNKTKYGAALDLAWNGPFANVLDKMSDVVNHDKRRFCGGGTYRHMAGLIRNLGTPVFVGLTIDTLCTSDFFFNYSPTVNPMPPWFALASVFFPMLYFGLTIIFIAYPDIADSFTRDSAKLSRGIFLNESYAFGLDMTGVEKDSVVVISKNSSEYGAEPLEYNI